MSVFRAASVVPFLLFVGLSGCGSDGFELVVDLRTDLVSGVEFSAVRTTVMPETRERAATRDLSFLEGIRVAELEGLKAGPTTIDVQLIDADGLEVAKRTVRLDLRDDTGVTVLVTRDCRGVLCPGPADPSTHVTCFGGTCVDPACVGDADEAACPAPECSADTDCPAPPASCASTRCDRGRCLSIGDDTLCASGAYCAAEVGCLSTGVGAMDASVRDGGVVTDGGVPDAAMPDAALPDAGACDPAACVWGRCAGSACDDPVRLALGPSNGCAVRRGGAVVCWGENDHGQVGTGSSGALVLEPTPVAGLVDGESVSVGLDHACAIRAGGQAVCWGRNEYATLGDGTRTGRLTPVAVSGLGDAMMIEAGTGHSCAIRTSGQAVCWGSNEGGRLGDGTIDDRLTPTDVSGLDDAIDIAPGTRHTCAVRAGGQAVCWGDDISGVLGNGPAGDSLVPTNVVGLDDAVQIAAGIFTTCAVRRSGQGVCWGSSSLGGLGNGATSGTRDVPGDVIGLADAIEIATSGFNGCALRRTGEVSCWGANSVGQLGDGSGENQSLGVAVVGLTGATSFASSGSSSAAVTPTRVVAWGANESGQLGDGSIRSRPTPVDVRPPR